MIKKYDNLIVFIQDIHNLKNTMICVPKTFIEEVSLLKNEQYHILKDIMKKNNIKVLEMKNNVKSNFKAK